MALNQVFRECLMDECSALCKWSWRKLNTVHPWLNNNLISLFLLLRGPKNCYRTQPFTQRRTVYSISCHFRNHQSINGVLRCLLMGSCQCRWAHNALPWPSKKIFKTKNRMKIVHRARPNIIGPTKITNCERFIFHTLPICKCEIGVEFRPLFFIQASHTPHHKTKQYFG